MNDSENALAVKATAFMRDMGKLRGMFGTNTTWVAPDKLIGDAPYSELSVSREEPASEDWRARIARFASDLMRLRLLLPTDALERTQHAAQSASARQEYPAVTPEHLRELGRQLTSLRSTILSQATALRRQLDQEWPGNPRLCEASLFGPLALRNKEVPLTNALAWTITPRGGATSLRCALLAATIALVLQRSVSPENVAKWTVRAEEPVDVAGDYGRIDIFAEGHLDSKRHIIAIEAKINAPEGNKQLEKYQRALDARAEELSEKDSGTTAIVFLTRAGTVSRSSNGIIPISYAQLLQAWLPVLRAHEDDVAAPFVRLLLADIARDLADMHLGEQLSMNGSQLPKHLDAMPTPFAAERHDG